MLGRVVVVLCLSATAHVAALPVALHDISVSTGSSLSPRNVPPIQDIHNAVTLENLLDLNDAGTYLALEARKVTSRRIPLVTTPKPFPTLPPAGPTFTRSTTPAFAASTSIRPAIVPTTTNGVPLPSALPSGAGGASPAFPSLAPSTRASPNPSSGAAGSAGAGSGTGKVDSSPSVVRTLVIVIVVLAVLLAIAVGVAVFLAIKLKKMKAAVVVRADSASEVRGLEEPEEKGLHQSKSALYQPQYMHEDDQAPLVAPGAYPGDDEDDSRRSSSSSESSQRHLHAPHRD